MLKVELLLGEKAVGRALWFGLREIAYLNTVEPSCDRKLIGKDLKIVVFWYLTSNHSSGYKCFEWTDCCLMAGTP